MFAWNKTLPALGISLLVAALVGFNVLSDNALNKAVPVASSAVAVANLTHGHDASGGHTLNVQSFADRHVEAQVQPNGLVRLYFYGAKEKQLEPIPTESLEGEVLPQGENGIPLVLKPRPYPGEPKGTASRFEGQASGISASTPIGVNLTIPYQGHIYRVQWRPEMIAPSHYRSKLEQEIVDNEHQATLGDTTMPAPLANRSANDTEATPEEKALFLTPGGKYTGADIAANDRQIAAIKYRGQMASHNRKPKKGDRLCPITRTVANARFTWVIQGKTYSFCCPPCIEEFVRQAKEDPASIQAPERYVQK